MQVCLDNLHGPISIVVQVKDLGMSTWQQKRESLLYYRIVEFDYSGGYQRHCGRRNTK